MGNNVIECDLETSIRTIFSFPPRPPCTYEIGLKDNENISLFQLLMGILVSGAKKLYGDDITAEKITKEQFSTLEKYFASIGYVIKYKYTYKDDNTVVAINLWFEPYIKPISCRGRKMF
jgi:hypothetical protein